ncbi:MAG: hypothetical protein ABIP97_05420 [Chthoniobacterales bacterium]
MREKLHLDDAHTLPILPRQLAQPRAPQPEDDPHKTFSEMRKQVLRGTSTKFDLPAPVTATEPWGVMMETTFQAGSLTLIALSDGTASIYLSSGEGSIGGGQHESIRNAAQRLVALGASFQPGATRMRMFTLPMNGQAIFYLLTDSGVFGAKALEDDFTERRHPWSALYFAAHEIITQYHHLEKQNRNL